MQNHGLFSSNSFYFCTCQRADEKKKLRGRTNFGRINKSGSSPFASIMSLVETSYIKRIKLFLFVALINRAGGLYGRILTEVVSTYTRPRSRFSHTDRLSSVNKMFIIWRKQEQLNSFSVTGFALTGI